MHLLAAICSDGTIFVASLHVAMAPATNLHGSPTMGRSTARAACPILEGTCTVRPSGVGKTSKQAGGLLPPPLLWPSMLQIAAAVAGDGNRANSSKGLAPISWIVALYMAK